ncbi:MAG TPA: TIGR02281 family clan AA aspartic protease [Gammaproteobacteria bacterium]|nr:TIGR02281 family clan AA aspartic protease [Gammaproteobacteria bacterium]
MTIAMWVVVLGLLTLFFQDWWEKQNNPNQNLSLVSGADGVRELSLQRNRFGHYVASGTINGVPVVFLLDTGASDISVPADLARAIGLQRGRSMVYQTANGPLKVYATRLDRVDLGGIVLRNVRASINPGMQGNEVLLGMSFLKHLEFTQRGDTLIIRQYPSADLAR